MRVTIGLLAWNNWDDTADCLGTLAACEGDFAILVIDNGSTDGTPERVREQIGRLKVALAAQQQWAERYQGFRI